jgi:hypothetical protein
MEPRVERQPDGKTSTLSWQSGQETLLLQTEEDDGTYLTYAVQSFLTRMTKASMPALQSEKGM